MATGSELRRLAAAAHRQGGGGGGGNGTPPTTKKSHKSKYHRNKGCSDARGIKTEGIGARHRIHCVENNGSYETVEKDDKRKKMVDSLVYRYHRRVGFQTTERSAAFIAANPGAAQAAEQARSTTALKSFAKTISNHSIVECFALTLFPHDSWSQFLMRCRDFEQPNGKALQFQAPDPQLLISIMTVFLAPKHTLTAFGVSGRGAKATYVKNIFAAVSTMCTQCKYGKPSPALDIDISASIATKCDEQPQKRAPGFDFATDLPNFYVAVFTNTFWSRFKKIKHWAWILFAISTVGRASDVCEFCPLIEHTEFPKYTSYYDSDGMPKFCDVAFTNWKHRKPKHKGDKYYIRIWRNYLDVRFCPLSWLLLYVKYLKTEENRTTGRFFKAKHAAFEAMLNHVFANGGFPEGTTHSLRRSTYQWAGRCNAQETEMKLAARHTAQSNSFVKYVADGYADASNFEDAGLPDPIRKMWVWKRATPNKQPFARDFQD